MTFEKTTPIKTLMTNIRCGGNGFVKIAAFNALEIRCGRDVAVAVWELEHNSEAPPPVAFKSRRSSTIIALRNLVDWGRTHTSPNDPNSPHELLIAGVEALEREK